MPLKFWHYQYDNCAFYNLYGKNKPRTEEKPSSSRIIDLYLKGDDFDLQKKIFKLDNKFFDPEDSTAVLCRKEQEVKEEERIFVKQTCM